MSDLRTLSGVRRVYFVGGARLPWLALSLFLGLLCAGYGAASDALCDAVAIGLFENEEGLAGGWNSFLWTMKAGSLWVAREASLTNWAGKSRVVIADDHVVLREGLRALLDNQPDVEVVAVADDGREAIREVTTHKPDVVIMDLAMPRMNGMSAIHELKRRGVDTKILVLTMHKSDEYIHAALQAGANGYLLKDTSYSEVLMAIRSVVVGRTFLAAAIAGAVVSAYLNPKRDVEPKRLGLNCLTSREQQVLKLISEGRRNREIAQFLSLSVKTVERHRANIMGKLNLHNTAALTAFALEKSLL